MEIKRVIGDLGMMHRFFKSLFNQETMMHQQLPINLTQQKVLMFIKHHEMSNMSQISKMTGIEKGSFTTTADHLIKYGLVERVRSEKDRRIISLTLTKEGNKVAEEIIEAVDTYAKKQFDVLSLEEKEAFIKALGIISKCIHKMERRGE